MQKKTGSNQPKFLIVFPRGVPLGGVETSSLRLARGLLAAGCDVKLMIHGTKADCHPSVREWVWSCPHEFMPPEDHHDQASMAASYSKEAPARVIPNQSAPIYSVLRKAKQELRAELHILGICHSDFPDYYQLAYDNQDIVDTQFGVSRHICEVLDRRLAKPSRLLILGVEVPPVYPERKPHKRLELLYAGRIENYGKRCCELIPAGEALRRRGVDFRLTIAGDGPYYRWLQQDLKKVPWWRRNRYRILGPVTPQQVSKLYEQSDIYLSFTRFEGNSIAVMEALAHGCVPVLPRVSGTETVIEHGQTGWLGLVDAPDSLIDGCRILQCDRLRLATMSRAAWAYAVRHCDVGGAVRAVMDCTGN